MKSKKTNRRKALKALAVSTVATGASIVSARGANSKPEVVGDIIYDQDVPLFSSVKRHGDLLYIAGQGAHFDGDIKDHTKHVLDNIQKLLEENGSSMNNVLKVNVYLADLHDYHAMNEVYRGRFGSNPPVRTTVATYGGVPGDSLVEIDCIAAIN